MRRISILGLGRMGGALALALGRPGSGFRVIDLIVRRKGDAAAISSELPSRPRIVLPDNAADIDTDIVLVTTGDPDIAEAARWLAPRLRNRPVVLHTSGSLASTELSPCAEVGCITGSLHPLLSVSDAFTGSKRFRGMYFCVEGMAAAVESAREIVSSLGGMSISIETEFKPLYHASAVMSAGHLVALFSMAVEMLAICGISTQDAHKILQPLALSAVENLSARTPADALTGSFARLDISAFERHLASFDELIGKEIQEVFLLLGERSVELAESAGGDVSKAKELRERINIAKRKLGC